MNCEIISNYSYFSLNIFEILLINQFEATLLKLTNLVKKGKILMVFNTLRGYHEFVRRTALKEAKKIINNEKTESEDK